MSFLIFKKNLYFFLYIQAEALSKMTKTSLFVLVVFITLQCLPSYLEAYSADDTEGSLAQMKMLPTSEGIIMLGDLSLPWRRHRLRRILPRVIYRKIIKHYNMIRRADRRARRHKRKHKGGKHRLTNQGKGDKNGGGSLFVPSLCNDNGTMTFFVDVCYLGVCYIFQYEQQVMECQNIG